MPTTERLSVSMFRSRRASTWGSSRDVSRPMRLARAAKPATPTAISATVSSVSASSRTHPPAV
jgi:hypothetical protein